MSLDVFLIIFDYLGLFLKYNVFPVLLSKSYYNRKLNFIEPKDNNTYWKRNNSLENKEYNTSLAREGNISRSIMIGNSQDLSILSNIDLRISGRLSDNLKIQSVISDNNLPESIKTIKNEDVKKFITDCLKNS